MPKCGAKTRSGTPCQRAPVAGKKRCKLHGGASTGPKDLRGNKNRATPGSLYSKFLSDEELELSDAVELGKVDDELKLCRIRLRRALAEEDAARGMPELESMQAKADKDPQGLVTMQVHQVSRRRDYSSLVDRLLARIESLERTRLILLLKTPQGEEEVPPVSVTYTVIDASTPDAEP